MLPKSEFSKKSYAQTMFGYVVSIAVRDELIENGLAGDSDFSRVETKQGELVCYQITPQRCVEGLAESSKMQLVDVCMGCGKKRYVMGDEPYYIDRTALAEIEGMVRTKELFGSIPDKNANERKEILESRCLVDKEVYCFLHERYSRMEFIPIFLKDYNVGLSQPL